MKIKINKILKLALLSLLSILMVVVSFLIYKEVDIPKFTEQKSQVYRYSNKSDINYEVFLRPNKLYDKNYLEEGNRYITEYVDYIKANLNYEFKGEKDTEITGDYNIVAKVKGHTGDGEKQIEIWEKDFPIIKYKDFKGNNNTISVNEKINISLDEYNTFVKEIIESSNISCQVTLSIIMNVNLKGKMDKGPIDEKTSTSLIIPLNVSMFEIGGNNNVEKQGAIEETIQVQLPVNKNKMILLGIIIGFLSLVLIYLIFFTVPATPKDPLEKKINKVFKKHGDRLVALNSEVLINDTNIMFVKSIDDLVRIADEVEKPIFYRYSQDYKDINKFYVTDEDQIYIFDLADMTLKGEGDTSNILNDLENHKEIKVES